MGRPFLPQDVNPAADTRPSRLPFVGVMRIADDVRRAAPQLASHDGGRKTPVKARRPWPGPERRVSAPPVVLLVDDEPDQRELYKQFLAFAGYRVVLAGGGASALDAALATKPDVIIMDVAMPGMDGLEATRHIKELSATSRIPVIALSAYGEIPPEWAVAAGCETYLRKPILPHDLMVEIERVISAARRT
jgi:two-component system, cell cycle response regulator DivK